MALILTEEKMDKTTRVIFKCGRKACKHVWAIEYTHKRYDSLYRVENGNQIWRQEDYHCPQCNDECYVKATNVVGVYNEKHACNARCMSSTSGACSCSCGGANHGAGHLTVQEHIIEEEETAQEPEQEVEVAKPEPTKTETRYRVRVKTFSGEIKVYPAKFKKDAETLFSREIRWDCPEENMYVHLEDSGRERVEFSVIASCDLTKNGHTDPALKPAEPQLTDETITYTIVPRETKNGIPFIARVFVPGQEVQEYDPRPNAWWMWTEGDLVNAVNKQFKGAWYLSPEKLDARVAEMAKPTIEDITPEQTQEEPYTLTCSVCGYQETRDKNKTYQGIPRHCNKVMKVDFSEWESTPKQPKTFILREEAHPLKANATIYRVYHQNEDGTVGQPCYIGDEDRAEVERRLRASASLQIVG